MSQARGVEYYEGLPFYKTRWTAYRKAYRWCRRQLIPWRHEWTDEMPWSVGIEFKRRKGK